MPHFTLQLDVCGPVIVLIIGVSAPRQSAMKDNGLAIPPPVVGRFLVDTGASCSMIDDSIVSALNLQPTGQCDIHTPSTGTVAAKAFQYDIALMIHHDDNVRFFPTLPVISNNFGTQNIQGLLGRDVLEKCLLVYDGTAQTFSLAF